MLDVLAYWKEKEKTEKYINIFFSDLFSDPSLLLPPRDDLTSKFIDPSKLFNISRDEIGRFVRCTYLYDLYHF